MCDKNKKIYIYTKSILYMFDFFKKNIYNSKKIRNPYKIYYSETKNTSFHNYSYHFSYHNI